MKSYFNQLNKITERAFEHISKSQNNEFTDFKLNSLILFKILLIEDKKEIILSKFDSFVFSKIFEFSTFPSKELSEQSIVILALLFSFENQVDNNVCLIEYLFNIRVFMLSVDRTYILYN